jgi:hypothetical protein
MLLLREAVVEVASVVRGLHASTGAMRKSHPRTLAAEACIWKAGPRAVQPSCAKSVAVCAREGIHLGIGIEVLVRTKRPAVRLGMRGESRLMERRADARAGAEGPDWRWHVVVVALGWSRDCKALRILIMERLKTRRRRNLLAMRVPSPLALLSSSGITFRCRAAVGGGLREGMR